MHLMPWYYHCFACDIVLLELFSFSNVWISAHPQNTSVLFSLRYSEIGICGQDALLYNPNWRASVLAIQVSFLVEWMWAFQRNFKAETSKKNFVLWEIPLCDVQAFRSLVILTGDWNWTWMSTACAERHRKLNEKKHRNKCFSAKAYLVYFYNTWKKASIRQWVHICTLLVWCIVFASRLACFICSVLQASWVPCIPPFRPLVFVDTHARTPVWIRAPGTLLWDKLPLDNCGVCQVSFVVGGFSKLFSAQ